MDNTSPEPPKRTPLDHLITVRMILVRFWILAVVTLLLMARGTWAQQSPPARDNPPAETVAALGNEVRQLRLEIAKLRVDIHERRLQTLEQDIATVERERRQAESEEAAGQEQILSAEAQLAGQDLDPAERQEMATIRNALLSSEQVEVRRRRTEIAEREASLRKQWETERESANQARRTQQALLKLH
jgi:hypothetical protein